MVELLEDHVKKVVREKKVKQRRRKRDHLSEKYPDSKSSPSSSKVLIIPPLSEFTRKTPSLTAVDAEAVCRDLGFVPQNLCDVGAHDASNGHPLIARLYPLNRNELKGRYSKESLPFPTMMWMTSPVLKARISKIEVDGYIEIIQQRLADSPEALESMNRAHKAYAKERWGLLSEEDRVVVEGRGWKDVIMETGIAGMQRFDKVKCLHTHYAHFLARPAHGNIIGEWCHEVLQQPKYNAEVDRNAGYVEGKKGVGKNSEEDEEDLNDDYDDTKENGNVGWDDDKEENDEEEDGEDETRFCDMPGMCAIIS